MVRYSNQWPEFLESLLIALYGSGLTFSQIGQRVGKTKDAVSGKVKRFKARGVL